MSGDIGKMFSTGAMPWHGKGERLLNPATMDEAIVAEDLIGPSTMKIWSPWREPVSCPKSQSGCAIG